jgi:hypothetical protein
MFHSIAPTQALRVASASVSSPSTFWIPACAGMTVMLRKTFVIPAKAGIQNLKPGVNLGLTHP